MALATRHCSATFGLFLAAAVAGSCVSARPRVVVPQPNVPPHQRTIGDYAERIDDVGTWNALAATPGRQMVAHTQVVKVIIDTADQWRVYFLQSERWEIHYYFASRFLNRPGLPVGEHAAFNQREYRTLDRRFVLGTLTRYHDQNVWAFDLLAGDILDIPRTVRAFHEIRRRVFFGNVMRYRPVPPHHERAVSELAAAGLPIVTTNDLFGATRYQPLNPGEAFGYLRFIRGAPDPSHVRRTDIVVLSEVPLDLPVCAGIVTAELQAPLGHVAVLAGNRGTPNMALRGVFDDPRLRALEGRIVRLNVTPQDYTIESATQEAAERAWESRRPRTPFSPPLANRDPGLPDVRTLHRTDVDIVGAKAAQLGELAFVQPPVNIPRAFAVPFAAYLSHLARNRIDAELRALLARADVRDDPQVREQVLTALRDHITHAPVDPALLAAIRARARSMFPGTRIRFRSSTNAEDLPGFNGAGLYRSVVVRADASDNDVADALRAVWASVWNFQGYEERAYFRIDQTRVAMAILVQESIDDDVIDGVAITGNPFNQGRPGFYVNAQLAGAEGGAVTSARGDEVPEQFIYYTYNGEGEFERLSRSSRANGGVLIRDDEVVALSQVLRAIQQHFNPGPLDYPNPEAMDVEFIVSGPQRRIVVVQARPYTLRWDEGRGWALPP